MRVPGTLLRLTSVVVLAGVGVAALTAAIVPQAASLATAHVETASTSRAEPSGPALRHVRRRRLGAWPSLKAEENRKPVALSPGPQPVIDTVLAVEDADFYEHRGVNAPVARSGRFSPTSRPGGVDPGRLDDHAAAREERVCSRRSATRTARSRRPCYAVRLESTMTKDEILERYLNTVYFGNGAYGVQAAAELYFGNDVGQLDYPQAAFLAGLIRNPVGYDPFRFPASGDRAARVALTAWSTSASSLVTRPTSSMPRRSRPRRRSAPPRRRPRTTSSKRSSSSCSTTCASATPRRSATTRCSRAGCRSTRPSTRGCSRRPCRPATTSFPTQAASSPLRWWPSTPASGAVRAMVGGPGFENAKFNLATQGIRQPGSSIKTFVLVAALEAGVRPTDIIDGTSPCRFPLPGGAAGLRDLERGRGRRPDLEDDRAVDQLRVRPPRAHRRASTGSSTPHGAWASRRSSSPCPR